MWHEANTEIEVEFDNFASACVTGLCVIDQDTLQLRAVLRIAAVLENGVQSGPKCHYRWKLLYQVWTLALARIHIVVTKLEEAGPEHWTELYMLLLTAIYFSSHIGRYRELNETSGDAAGCRKVIAQYAMWAGCRIPEAVVGEESQPKSSRAFKALKKIVRMASDPGCSIRLDICGYIDDDFFDGTTNPFGAGTPPASLAGQPASLEIDLVTMMSISAEFGKSAKLTNDAITAAQRRDWATADKLLETALELELNGEEHDCANRARLLGLQVLVADGQNDSERAQQLREEQSRLEHIVARAGEGSDGENLLPRL